MYCILEREFSINLVLQECNYIKEAYKAKKWAFVSDYVRMKVLYEYGGIYFDTDVEVLKPFPEEILLKPGFTGFESFSGLVNPGLVYACEKHDPFASDMLNSYRKDIFQQDTIDKIKTINIRITELLEGYGLRREDREQQIGNLTVYPSSVFCAYDGKRRKTVISPDTLSIHHYSASWLPLHRKVRLKIGTALRHLFFVFKKDG